MLSHTKFQDVDIAIYQVRHWSHLPKGRIEKNTEKTFASPSGFAVEKKKMETN